MMWVRCFPSTPPPQRPSTLSSSAGSHSFYPSSSRMSPCISWSPPSNYSSKVNSYTPFYMLQSLIPTPEVDLSDDSPGRQGLLHMTPNSRKLRTSWWMITSDQVPEQSSAQLAVERKTELLQDSFYPGNLPMLRHMFPMAALSSSHWTAVWRLSIRLRSLECLCLGVFMSAEWHDPANVLRTPCSSHWAQFTQYTTYNILDISTLLWSSIY